jgi:hypothetical protein
VYVSLNEEILVLVGSFQAPVFVLKALASEDLQFGHDAVEARAEILHCTVFATVLCFWVVQNQLFESDQIQQSRHPADAQLVVGSEPLQFQQVCANVAQVLCNNK